MTCCGLKIKKKIKSLTLLKGKLLTWFQLLKKTFIYQSDLFNFVLTLYFGLIIKICTRKKKKRFHSIYSFDVDKERKLPNLYTQMKEV